MKKGLKIARYPKLLNKHTSLAFNNAYKPRSIPLSASSMSSPIREVNRQKTRAGVELDDATPTLRSQIR